MRGKLWACGWCTVRACEWVVEHSGIGEVRHMWHGCTRALSRSSAGSRCPCTGDGRLGEAGRSGHGCGVGTGALCANTWDVVLAALAIWPTQRK